MKKFFIFLVLFLAPVFAFLSASPVHAASVDPFPPFSVEGNPPEDYFFEIFKLFRYFRPRALEIYENMDRSRTYVDLQICPGPGSDHRDQECNNQGDTCDGGEVDLCYATPPNVGYARPGISQKGTCKYNKSKNLWADGELVEGTCDYTKRPDIVTKVKGPDFSTREAVNAAGINARFSDLVYPKIQSETGAYSQIGTADNPITWGSQYLNSDICESDIRRVVVVRRAKQTKNTLRETGQWPLGWVDWGYTIPSGKTLLDVNDSLPDDIASNLNGLIEGLDDFYLTAGNLEKTSDVSQEKKAICAAMKRYRSQSTPPAWLKDFELVPLYAPSFRRGYVRPSICVWELCCPTFRCPLEIDELLGAKRGLYYDISVSQAYNAALDELFLTYSREEGAKIFTKLLSNNPLIRYLSSAAPAATPKRITAEMNIQLKDTCLKYIPWDDWLGFGTHMDYLDSGAFLGPNKTCPDYDIMPDASKERAEATPTSLVDAVINLIWGRKVDDVEPVRFHLLTIPDLMGQSLGEIQQYVYDTRDTLSELEATKDYNLSLSNTVDDGKDGLFAGKSLGPADAKRRLGYYACNDSMFSSELDTSIEAYALGTRIGCDQAGDAVPEGKCDGQLFAKMIEGSKYENTSPKGEAYFNTNIKPMLTPELMNTYAAAEKETGVPCEILAGIHFVEADNNPDGSLVSGRKLGTAEPDAGGKVFRTLLETAKYAGDHLKGKVGGNLKDAQTAITALSRYNGGGNSNCQLGYPYAIPYKGCPRAFEGEDDPYPTSFIDGKHDSMYLLYCADRTACVPQVFERPGSFTVALNVYNSMTKSGYSNSDLPKEKPKSSTAPSNSQTKASNSSSGFFPKSCGPDSLSTALGCLPYTSAGFISTLLSFLIGISGAIALTTMLVATIQIMTASGDAKKLQSGRDLFSSALAGLLFLIFSVSLLRLIAGDIIKLPGF